MVLAIVWGHSVGPSLGLRGRVGVGGRVRVGVRVTVRVRVRVRVGVGVRVGGRAVHSPRHRVGQL